MVHMKKIMALIGAALLILGFGVLLASPSQATGGDDHKRWVCKYVGTPGEDERLKDGKNPISVDSSATVGTYFNDAHGRSYVLAVQTESNTGPGNTYKGNLTCPPGDDGDDESPTPTPTPTETSATPTPTPTETSETPTPTPTPTETSATPTPTETSETPTPTPTETTGTPTPSETSTTSTPTPDGPEKGGPPPTTLAKTGASTPWLGGGALVLLLAGIALIGASLLPKREGAHL
jgi:hypothetical protein